jgi:hypothetical protein
MYAVTPECKAAWRIVLDWLLGRAGVKARHEDHDPPKLLSDLWARDDLACVMMCGLPFSLRTPQALVLAAPVPRLPRYGGAGNSSRDYFIGEKAVGRRIVVVTCSTIGPFFSLSPNTRARSGSLENVSNLLTRSLRLSQASM